jgi:hypothetical protein
VIIFKGYMIMELKELKNETICSDCGAVITSESRSNFHTNGHWNEYREFKCGRKIHFSPNFMKIIVEVECPKNPTQKRKIAKQKRLVKAITEMVNKSRVTKEYKERLLRDIKWW